MAMFKDLVTYSSFKKRLNFLFGDYCFKRATLQCIGCQGYQAFVNILCGAETQGLGSENL